MHIYIGFDDTDTPDSDRGTGNWPAGLETNYLSHAGCGAWFASNYYWITPFLTPLIIAQPARSLTVPTLSRWMI